MSERINQFCKGLGMDQESRQSMTEKDISYQLLNKSVADLLSSDDEKDTSEHRALVENKILEREDIDSIENYNDCKLQVIFGKNPDGRKSDKNEIEQLYNGLRGEEFKILYIDNLTTLRRIIISRKEIVRKNLDKLEINEEVCSKDETTYINIDDNDEIIKRFIEYINIKLGINIYQELRKIYQEETSERVDLVVNKVYDKGLSENHKRRLKNNKDDNGKEKLPDEELDKGKEEIPDENTLNLQEIPNKKLDKGLGLKDFNILVQEGKIDIKTFKFIINLLNNKLKVNINNLYYLCESGSINKLSSCKIKEIKLIELINNTTIEKLSDLINTTNTEKLSYLINNTSIANLSNLINNTNIADLSYLINNADIKILTNLINYIINEKLIEFINNTNSWKLSYSINNTNTKNLSELITITNIVNLSELINITNAKKLSELINTTDIENLSELINNTNYKNLSELIHNSIINNFYELISTTDAKKLSELINDTDIEKLSELINTTNIKKLSELINLIKIWELRNLINNTIIVNLNRAIEKDFDKLIVYLNGSKYMIHNTLYMNVKYFLNS